MDMTTCLLYYEYEHEYCYYNLTLSLYCNDNNK